MITHKKQVNWRLIAFHDNGLAASIRFPERRPSRRSGIRFDLSAFLTAVTYSDPSLCLAGQDGFPQESRTGFGRSSTLNKEGMMGMSHLQALVRRLIDHVRQIASPGRSREDENLREIPQPVRPQSWRDQLDQAPRKRWFKIFE